MMQPKKTKWCPYCGEVMGVGERLGDGTILTWTCVNDYCPIRAAARDEAESVDMWVRALVLPMLLLMLVGVAYTIPAVIERVSAEACVADGGTWSPVRGIVPWWPSGRGVCQEDR